MSETRGRAIRVLIAKPGLDGHDVGAKLVCRALVEAGMEVIYTGLRQSPKAIVSAAVQEDVDVLGLSVLSGAHVGLCRQVRDELRAGGRDDLLWLVGGTIPRQDHQTLRELGVDAVFDTGKPFAEIIAFIEEHARA